jgi:hypothetical protein
MRAILIAPCPAGAAQLHDDYPGPLLPLCGRPFLQHVVEFLAAQGVRRFDVVLSERPERVEELLGDGGRWGVGVTYHLARDPTRPYRPLRAVDFGGEPALLLAHADRLPRVVLAEERGPTPRLFYPRGDGPTGWSGWALLSPDHLASLPPDADEMDLERHLLKFRADGSRRAVPVVLGARTLAEAFASQRALLAGEFPGLAPGGRERVPGVWISRNVAVHPTALLIPPVFAGENCLVGAGARLGPNAALGSDCVLARGSDLREAIVLPGTYVGEEVELEGVVVDRDRLILPAGARELAVPRPDLLGDLTDRPVRRWLAGLLRRAVAVVLLVAALPVLLPAALWFGVRRRPAVRIPAARASGDLPTFSLLSLWPEGESPGPRGVPPTARGFLLGFLPALVNVARGELHFVGLPPRSPEEVDELPDDWRAAYLRGGAGVVTEAAVLYRGEPTAHELYATELLHARTGGLRHDAGILLRYLARTFIPFL